MKKVLLFLLLFGGGLALLLLLQEEAVEPTIEDDQPQRPPDDIGPPIQIPIEGGAEEGSQLVNIWIPGEIEWTGEAKEADATGKFPRVYHCKLRDPRPIESDDPQAAASGRVLAEEVSLLLFDTATDTVRAQLEATRGYLGLERSTEGGLEIARSIPVRLESVDLTILRGAPLVPITFRVPVLTWTRIDEAFRSEDRVVLESPGLEAEGTGLVVVTREGRESVTLVRDGSMRLDLEEGLEARLDATGLGPLVLSRQTTEAGDVVRLTIDDGARLELQDGSVLTAQSLTIEGVRTLTPGSEDEGSFRLTRADATGRVVIVRAEGELRGSEASLEFDAAGGPRQLTVSGRPSADLELPSSSGEVVRVHVEGAGPLTLRAGTPQRFELAGPAVATWPDEELEVRADDWIRGSLFESERRVSVQASGAVRALLPDATLEGPSLDLDVVSPTDEELHARIALGAPGRFAGRDAEGRMLDVETEGPLRARFDRVGEEDEVFIERAEVVRARFESPLEDERPFDATAALVRDLDTKTRAFVAEGGVTWEALGATATADRVVAHSDRDLELFGTPAEPARFEVTGEAGLLENVDALEASARELHVTAERVAASGDVDLAVQDGEARFTARADRTAFEWLGPEDADGARRYRLSASDVERAGVENGQEALGLACRALLVEGVLTDGRPGPLDLAASGGVRIELAGRERELSRELAGTSNLVGHGERFTWSVHETNEAGEPDWSAGRGRLETDPGQRVRSVGHLAGEQLPYELTADWITFSGDSLEAAEPRLRIDSTNLPTSRGPGARDSGQAFEATARTLTGSRESLRLTDEVRLVGESRGRYSWSLDSDEVEIRFDLDAPPRARTDTSPMPSALERVVARGNLNVVFNEELRGSGEVMTATGTDLRLEGSPARLGTAAFGWESDWIEYSLADQVVTTGSGKIKPGTASEDDDWEIRYESLQPFQEGEVTILALRNARVTRGEDMLRSNWALFWIDNEEWRKAENPLVDDSANLRTEPSVRAREEQDGAPPARMSLFGRFRTSSISKVLNEIYVEGDVEYLIGNERFVRAQALYVDLVDGHSWIQGADLRIKTPETQGQSMSVKSEWIRHSRDGSLRAEDATLTSCSHEVPHYVVEVGELRLDPIEGEESGNTYRLSLKDNSLRFQNGARIPLPETSIESGENGSLDAATLTVGGLTVPRITFGSSNQFGTTVRTNFSRSFGRIGRVISRSSEKFLNLGTDSVRGNWNYNAAWFGSRGILLGIGFDVTDNDRFWMRAQADGIPDRQRDRGIVRVPEDERSTFRGWYRLRGRYTLDDDEWIDFRFTKQTDAGVQAEFFERDFIAFEQRETYLHWRKAHDQFFYASTVEAAPNASQTEVQELPSFLFQRGRTPLGKLLGTAVLYSATARVEHLRRHSGSQEVPFADGLSGPSVTRLDTTHRFETPYDLDWKGLRLTPFVEGRGTVWSDAMTGPGEPLRAALAGGADLTTAIWKRYSGDRVHTLSPRLGTRVTMGVDESGGAPIFFDHVEMPVQGHFVDAGLRSLWRTPDPNRYIDLDVTATHASDVAANVNGWAVRTYGHLRQYLAGMPIAVVHDARYDLDDSRTDYSRTFFGIKPWERFEIGTGYNSGRVPSDERLYETASISTRFIATPKWDLEFHQTFNLAGTEDLATRFVIRRFGHDLLFELELRDTAGAGTGFSIGFRPRVGWRRSTLGLFDN